MSTKEPAEMNNAPMDTEAVLKDALAQIEAEEAKEKLFDTDAVDAALILEGRMNERVREVFEHAWNTKLRQQVENRIQEEIAALGFSLGKNIRDLMDSRIGKL